METSLAINAEIQVGTEPRDGPQASRQGEPLPFSRHAAWRAPAPAAAGPSCTPIAVTWLAGPVPLYPSEGAGQPEDSPQPRASGTSVGMRQVWAEEEEGGKGCLLSTPKQVSHPLTPRLLGQQGIHIKLKNRHLKKIFSPVCPSIPW